MSLKALSVASAIGLAMVALATPASAAPSYIITDLGSAGSVSSEAYAINNKGQVVGYDWDGSVVSAYIWDNGIKTNLGSLGGTETYANAINDKGQVIGSSKTADNVTRTFLWENGVMTDIGTFNTSVFGGAGINDSGQMVGSSYFGSASHAVLLDGGVMTDLGAFGGPYFSGANDINDIGQIVGQSDTANGSGRHAFVWENGVMTDIGTLGGTIGIASAINENGQVAGTSFLSNNTFSQRGFFWENGVMTDIGVLAGFNNRSSANDINASGQVVGYSYAGNFGSAGIHAILWESGVLTDLNDLINPASGWSLGFAKGINDAGQIVGTGSYNGTGHAFLLTPVLEDAVPEPGTWALMMGGFGLIGGLSRWTRRRIVFA